MKVLRLRIDDHLTSANDVVPFLIQWEMRVTRTLQWPRHALAAPSTLKDYLFLDFFPWRRCELDKDNIFTDALCSEALARMVSRSRIHQRCEGDKQIIPCYPIRCTQHDERADGKPIV